jgi:asparagine synthase (glutamine-hydrolysing)
MCGFAGILNSRRAVDTQTVSRIAGLVSFRGPDATGIRIYDEHLQARMSGPHAFFFNRLSILDLDPRSNQPFEDNRYTLLFNGEIYNYRELRAALESAGTTFHTTSDTEVLFQCLRTGGIDAIPRLNGMFAFVWIDRKERRFIMARDRIGIKPLYYAQDAESFIFGSELDSVVRFSGRPARLRRASVQEYLWLQYVPSPFTIAENVYKLPAGHYREGSFASAAALSPSRPFWDAYRQVQAPTRDENLETLLLDSLRGQLHADVPVGLFLSSGVDSSLLAALVHRHFARNRPFTFLTIGFNEKTHADESAEAVAFLKGFNNPNLVHRTLPIDAGFIGNALDSLYDYYDEPFGDPASLLNWVISVSARREVKVALSGDGGDELFWGYPRYNEWKESGSRRHRRLPFRRLLAGLVRRLPPSVFRHKLARRLVEDPVELHRLILRPYGFAGLPDPENEEALWWRQGIEEIKDREDLTNIIDLKTYLVDAMLYKTDRSSMAASLEVRVPYLDNPVIDYALALPWKKKSTPRFPTKAILKELLVRLAPHYPVDRPKKGFSFPLNRWLHQQWKDRTLAAITPSALKDLDLDPPPFLKIVETFYRGQKDWSAEVWRLLNLTLWYNKFKKLETRTVPNS